MQPAGDVRGMLRPPGPHRTGRRDTAAGHQGRGVMHAEKDRIVRGTDTPGHIGHTGLARDLDRVDVGRIVDQTEHGIVGGCDALDGDVRPIEHPEGARERHRQLDPDRIHRVPLAEVVGGEAVIPGDQQGDAHIRNRTVSADRSHAAGPYARRRRRPPPGGRAIMARTWRCVPSRMPVPRCRSSVRGPRRDREAPPRRRAPA